MKPFILTASAWMLGTLIAHADILADARKIHDAHQDSVVYLKAVIEVERRGAKQEATLETLGTIISEDGLIVTSNSMLGQVPDGEGNAPELRDLKMTTADGIELPAKLVLQDTDLDLAFVQIEVQANASKFKSVSLPEQGPEFELFDQFVTLGRQEEDLQRKSSLHVGRIISVVKRPRLVYGTSVGSFGAPVFNAKGDLVGIFVRKIYQDQPGSLIVLPSKDVHKVAQQALSASATEKVDEPSTTESATLAPEENGDGDCQ